jgi:hypothetical protein
MTAEVNKKQIKYFADRCPKAGRAESSRMDRIMRLLSVEAAAVFAVLFNAT